MTTRTETPQGQFKPRPLWQTVATVFAWLLAVSSAIGQWVFQATASDDGALAEVLEPSDFTGALLTIAVATVGASIVLRGSARTYGWIMLSVGLAVGLIGFAAHYSVYGQDVDVPFVAAAIWIQDLWMIVFFGLFLMTALFPDGSAPSARWSRPVKLVAAAWVALIVVFAFIERSATNFFEDLDDYLTEIPRNPAGFLPIPEAVISPIWAVMMLLSIAIGLGSLVSRWRHADGEMRLRLKWVLWAFGILLGVLSLSLVNQALIAMDLNLGLRQPLNVLMSAAQVGLVVAFGFGVLKFRLYDVDMVINRTVVYGLLTMMIVVTYVGLVVGLGELLPIEESVLALAVTAGVALAFAPVKNRVQGWVNRIMFGRRDDPYSVLAEMGRLLARSGTPESTLRALIETVATSLKLPGASIELEQDGEWREVATYGHEQTEGLVRIPVAHQGEVIGRLTVTPRSPAESLSSKDIALLEDVAHQAGALARSVRLTAALQRSRERLVLAQEEERRRIRHDLHDELGPTLASQTLQLDTVLEQIEEDPDRAANLVKVLKKQNQQLVADIRRLVYELRPPALDELGVAGALEALTSQIQQSSPLTIDLNTVPDPLPELPAAVEVAAYRITREAVINSVRHAEANKCSAILEATGSDLVVTVSDDGMGFDRTTESGVGLTSMRERTEELGGSFTITSTNSHGTRVRARLPLVDTARPSPTGVANG